MQHEPPSVTGRACVAGLSPSFRGVAVGATWVQGPLLAYLVAADAPLAVALVAAATLAAGLVARALAAPGGYAGLCTVAMLALGNLGMLLGWMADFGFGPLVREGLCLCGCADSVVGRGLVAGARWMHAGMLAACIPALVAVRPARAHLEASPSARARWAAHVALCPVGMLAGMLGAAGLLASAPVADPALRVVASFAAMGVGMAAGMLATCRALDALELRASRPAAALGR
ncbi:MAG: hypothetical protein R3E88_08710 [Myxococcota bacterium]